MARFWNITYFVLKFPAWIEMWRRFLKQNITEVIKRKNTITVQTADHAWYDPDVMAKASNLTFLAGDHDVCWRDYAYYSRLITDYK